MRQAIIPINTHSLFEQTLGSLFDNGLLKLSRTVGDASLLSRMDIVDEGASYTITADLPGVEQERVTVEAADEKLTVKVQAKETTVVPDQYLLRERTSKTGEASRTFVFDSQLDTDTAKATLNGGVLQVTVLKKATSDKRVITIS